MESTDKHTILNALDMLETKLTERFDELSAATANGFARTEERLEDFERRLEKIDERQSYLELKIDKRFDLIENMTTTNRRIDRDETKTLDVRVTNLETASV